MSNPDRLMRQAREHAETLLDSHGEDNGRSHILRAIASDTGGFWSRVLSAFNDLVEERDNENDDDPAADYGDWRFHQDHDQ
jgi:hypothetical protein